MFAVIRKSDPFTILKTCRTKEAALIAAQLEKDRTPPAERSLITAVVLDDGGYEDILF